MTMGVGPQAGAMGFYTIAGHVGGAINIGQALLNDSCRFSHVFIVVYPIDHPDYPDGLIQEAMPGGMRVRPLTDRLGPGYAYAEFPREVSQDAVRKVAQSFMPTLGGVSGREVGPGYSFFSYPVLGLAQYRVTRWLTPGLEKLIDRSGDWICSQHADEFWHRLGYQAFDDGRWRGDVTPGDLYYSTDSRVIRPAPRSVNG